MHKQRLFTILLSVFVILAGLQELSAQVTNATISGTIRDASGAVVAGASLQIKNAGTGITKEVSSNEQGRYIAPSLPVGNYDVRASKPGFQNLVHNGITLTVGR